MFGRRETALLKDQLHELKASAKTWASATRSAAQTETKLLLTKVESACCKIAVIEGSCLAEKSRIKALQDRCKDLQARLDHMVPVSDMQAAKAESGRLRATNGTLNQNVVCCRRRLRS